MAGTGERWAQDDPTPAQDSKNEEISISTFLLRQKTLAVGPCENWAAGDLPPNSDSDPCKVNKPGLNRGES